MKYSRPVVMAQCKALKILLRRLLLGAYVVFGSVVPAVAITTAAAGRVT